MYYAYIPNNYNLFIRFSGWTDNEFLYKKYSEMMNDFGLQNILDGETFSTKIECLRALHEAWQIFTRNNKLESMIFFERNKLYSIHSGGISEENVVVVNEDIFDDFTEQVMYKVENIAKLIVDMTKACNPTFVHTIIPSYLANDDSDIKVLKDLMIRLCEILDKIIKEIGEDNLNHPYRFEPLYEFPIWDYFDKATMIHTFIEVQIRKVFLPVKYKHPTTRIHIY